MANLPAKESGPGLVATVAGGVIGAIVLFWLAGVVIGTIVFAVRIVVVIAVLAGALWLWGKVSRS